MSLPRPVILLAIAAIYVAASWLIYGATLHAPFLLDDQEAIQMNSAIRAWWPLAESLDPPPAAVAFSRRPLANLSMALNFAAGDLDVSTYRTTNLVLHAINAWLLFLILNLLLGRAAPRINPPAGQMAAFFAGLLWVVHPLASAAVHYLTQRPEMLMTAGLLVMVYAQLRSQESARPRTWLTLAAGGCLFGMGSKESMALAPVLAVLLDRCSTKWSLREQLRRRGIYYAVLFATLAWPLSRLAVENSDVVAGADLERRWRYFLTVSEGVVRHLWLTVWPARLVFDYGMVLVEKWTDVAWHLGVVLACAVAVLVGLWHRKIIAWAGAVAFGVLLPSWINLAPGQPVAEHRFYLPLGILLAIAAAAAARLITLRPALARPLLVLAVLATGVFGLAGRQRAALFAEPVKLMTADITAWPRSDRGYFNLALVQEFEGDYAAAAESYERSLERSAGLNWRHLMAMTRFLLRNGDTQRAVPCATAALQEVIELKQEDELRAVLGILVSSFRATGSLPLVPDVLRPAPPAGDLQPLIDEVLLQITTELEGSAVMAAELASGGQKSPALRVNLAVALAREGRHAEALVLIDELLSGAPPETSRSRRADLLALRGGVVAEESDKAEALNEAVRLDPNHAEALNNLAWLLATTRDPALFDPARAVQLSGKACRLAPDEAFFRGTLAVALAASGQEKASREEAERARRTAERSGVELTKLDEALQAAQQRAGH